MAHILNLIRIALWIWNFSIIFLFLLLFYILWNFVLLSRLKTFVHTLNLIRALNLKFFYYIFIFYYFPIIVDTYVILNRQIRSSSRDTNEIINEINKLRRSKNTRLAKAVRYLKFQCDFNQFYFIVVEYYSSECCVAIIVEPVIVESQNGNWRNTRLKAAWSRNGANNQFSEGWSLIVEFRNETITRWCISYLDIVGKYLRVSANDENEQFPVVINRHFHFQMKMESQQASRD